MKSVVRFEGVSKQYRLGASQTSVLRALSHSLKNLAKPGQTGNAEQQLLWALRDINFELLQGESLALVGRNGAGKSTLLKLLANITRPTAGSISVDGRVSALIELGSGFHPDLTGRENIFLNGTVLGLKRREVQQRFDEIVAFSEIENFIETPVKRYSSGMLVRLGFAVASCIEPDILLVDEVLAVGDAAFRQKCLMRIHSLLENGTSIIFVSHNINMVEAVCSKAIYIKQGQIVCQGKTGEAIDAYERDLHEEQARKLDIASPLQQAEALANVQLTQIELLNEAGLPLEQCRSEQAVVIRVSYTALHSIAKVDAVIRIVRSDGLTCCMLRTAVDHASFSLQQGEGSFSVRLDPLQLIGGSYFVNAYISTERDLVLLANGRSDWFYVAGAPLSHEKESGVFEPRRKWLSPTGVLPERFASPAVPNRLSIAAGG